MSRRSPRGSGRSSLSGFRKGQSRGCWWLGGQSEFDVGRFCLSVSEFDVGRFCLSVSEFNLGFSCLVSLATVRGGTSFLCPTATKKQKQRKRLQTPAFRECHRTVQLLARK